MISFLAVKALFSTFATTIPETAAEVQTFFFVKTTEISRLFFTPTAGFLSLFCNSNFELYSLLTIGYLLWCYRLNDLVVLLKSR